MNIHILHQPALKKIKDTLRTFQPENHKKLLTSQPEKKLASPYKIKSVTEEEVQNEWKRVGGGGGGKGFGGVGGELTESPVCSARQQPPMQIEHWDSFLDLSISGIRKPLSRSTNRLYSPNLNSRRQLGTRGWLKT